MNENYLTVKEYSEKYKITKQAIYSKIKRGILKDKIVNDLGGLPPAKIHCSMLGVDALHAAIDSYRKKTKGAVK